MAIVEGLFIYPFKSARGLPRTSIRVASSGFEWDRNWMAVDANGKFLSQRTHPTLAQLVPTLTSDSLVLSLPGRSPLRLPLLPDEGPRRDVSIWRDRCGSIDQGDEAAAWLSGFLGQEVRIVRVPPRIERLANPKYAGSVPAPVTFVDGYPFLVCNRASLEDLNSRMAEPVPMERFRPSIVLGGLEPFAEDRIATVSLGKLQLRLVKPCDRCIITSTDQTTGERSTNPLPVLRTFRFDRELLGVMFGENAIIESGVGTELEVGREATVTLDG